MPVTLAGYVDEEPDVNGDKSQLIFRVKELITPDRTLAVDERTLMHTSAFPKYKFGDELLVTGVLKTPQNFVEDFDYVAYLKKQNIKTVMSFPKISKEGDLRLGFFEKAKTSLYKKVFILKDKFELAINKSVAEYAGKVKRIF